MQLLHWLHISTKQYNEKGRQGQVVKKILRIYLAFLIDSPAASRNNKCSKTIAEQFSALLNRCRIAAKQARAQD